MASWQCPGPRRALFLKPPCEQAPAPPSRTVLMQQALVQSISDMLVKDELK